MITMGTYSVYEYMVSKFPDDELLLKNGAIDSNVEQSIGIFLAPDSRGGDGLSLGGIACTLVRMLPVTIKVRWTQNQKECNDKAIAIYNMMLEQECNFTVGDASIATIQLLDSTPRSLGRDDKNVCEMVIRANFYYYI